MNFRQLSLVNKNINQLLNNIDQYLWYKIAINEYSLEFWNKALLRTKEISKPLNCYKLELKRLLNFENHNLKNNGEPLTHQQYFDLWNKQEQYYLKKKNKNISRFNSNYHFYINLYSLDALI
jgi:hypothetical protein